MRIASLFNDPMGFLLGLLYSLPAVIIALSFHEWGHAYAAYRLGDPTARNMGRMSIDPMRHLDPWGFICMIVVGFGWAKPVPVNVRNFRKPIRDDIIVSIAGVSVNFLLANAGMLIMFLGVTIFKIQSEIFYNFMSVFYSLNIALLVFNLLPIPPLDGYHVFKNLLIRKVNPNFFWNYERYGSYILMILILTRVLSGVLMVGVDGILGVMYRFYMAIFSLFGF